MMGEKCVKCPKNNDESGCGNDLCWRDGFNDAVARLRNLVSKFFKTPVGDLGFDENEEVVVTGYSYSPFIRRDDIEKILGEVESGSES